MTCESDREFEKNAKEWAREKVIRAGMIAYLLYVYMYVGMYLLVL